MLTLDEVPPLLEALHENSRMAAARIPARIERLGDRRLVPAQTDLFEWSPISFTFIESGIFRLLYEDRLVRFYGDGDLLLAEKPAGSPTRLVSEFGTRVIFFEKGAFLRALHEDPEARAAWLDRQRAEEWLLQGLCGVSAADGSRPEIRFRRFEPGEAIVREGDASEHIFVMLDGQADVIAQGVTVGAIGPDEVFGEISFLTGRPRIATVRATTPCIVQIAERGEFEQLVRRNPALILNISTTLARRIIELNERLTASKRP